MPHPPVYQRSVLKGPGGMYEKYVVADPGSS